MRGLTALLVGLAALALGACSVAEQKGAAEKAADTAYSLFARGDLAGLKSMSTPDLIRIWNDGKVRQLSALVPRQPARGGETLRWQITSSGGLETALIARGYHYAGKEVLWRTSLVHDPATNRWLLNAFDVRVGAPATLDRANSLTFAGKSALHYGAMAWLVLSVLFVVWALVAVVRARRFKWKWAFALLCLFSVGQLNLNWTTGEWNMQVFNIALLGMGLVKAPSAWGQWVLSVAFPLGALISLTRVAALRRERAAAVRETF